MVITPNLERNAGFLRHLIDCLAVQDVEYVGYRTTNLPEPEGPTSDVVREAGWHDIVPDHETSLVDAFNAGVDAGSGDRILFLSDDCYMRPGSLVAMLAHREPIVGCVIYTRGQVTHAGGGFNPAGLPHHFKGSAGLGPCRPVPWVTGNGMLITRDLWEKVGGFNPNYPKWGND